MSCGKKKKKTFCCGWSLLKCASFQASPSSRCFKNVTRLWQNRCFNVRVTLLCASFVRELSGKGLCWHVSVSGCFDSDGLLQKLLTFFQGLVWCQRTAEGLSTEPLGAFTFIAMILQSRVSLLVEFITFSRASQACCKWRWHQNSGSFSTGTYTVFVPFRSRNSWNSFLLKDKLKQTTSPLEGWGLKRKLLTVDNTIAFVVQHTLKSVI